MKKNFLARFLVLLKKVCLWSGFLGSSLLGSACFAEVFFRSSAESMACDSAVPISVWNYTGSGDSPNSRFSSRCSTPVPSLGHQKYFQVDFVNGQHDAWNTSPTVQISLSTSKTYYLGGFFRFDRINSQDIWHDGPQADSYDKLFEMYGSTRLLITAGWNNAYFTNGYDHQFTFGAYISTTRCSIGCEVNLVDANVAPYGRENPYLASYGRWYAVVMSVRPSSGNGAQNGLMELFINGTKIFTKTGATQDSTSPSIERFQYSGTVAQPINDAPTHYRKAENFVFADSLADVQGLKLMADPESTQGGLGPPRNLHFR